MDSYIVKKKLLKLLMKPLFIFCSCQYKKLRTEPVSC